MVHREDYGMLEFLACCLVLADVQPQKAEQLGAPTEAASIQGYYSVTGTTANGKEYETVGTITKLPSGAYRIHWAGSRAAGTGVLKGKRLSVGISQENAVGVWVAEIQGDGRLVGPWTFGGEEMMETWTFLRKFKE